MFRTEGARAGECVGVAFAGPLARRLPPCGCGAFIQVHGTFVMLFLKTALTGPRGLCTA